MRSATRGIRFMAAIVHCIYETYVLLCCSALLYVLNDYIKL